MATGPALEAARQTAVSALAGDKPAPTLDFLGFPVGRATRAQVSAWASANNVACSDVDGIALRCSVPASASVPVSGGVFYRFDATRLVGIDLIAPTTEDEAPKLFQRIRDSLTGTFGLPHSENNGATLTAAPAGRLSSSWRFADLALDISAFRSVEGTRLRIQARAIH